MRIKFLLSMALATLAYGQFAPQPVKCSNGNCSLPAGSTLTMAGTLPAGWYDLAAWGDSLTAGTGGTPWPTQYTTLTGTTTYNGGVGGYTSTQIATAFLADTTHRSWRTVIWSGRNNYGALSTVLADDASMVAALPTPKRFLVLSVTNADFTGEYSGQAGYNQIAALNSAKAAANPNNYLDVRSVLVAAYNPANAQDVIDHGHDVPPSSLRAAGPTGTLNGAITDTSTCAINLTNLSGTVVAGNTLTVGTEKIYASIAVAGNITGCTRGYAGTVAATHLTGAAYTSLDPVHLNTAGYLIVAQQVQAKLAAIDTNYVPGTVDIAAFFQSPPPTGSLMPVDNARSVGSATQPYAGVWAYQMCATNAAGLTKCLTLGGDNVTLQWSDGSVLACATDGGCNLGGSGANRWGYIFVKNFAVVGGVALKPAALSTYGTCTGADGNLVAVNDSNTTTYGATITGGSTNHVLAYCNGTAWTVH